MSKLTKLVVSSDVFKDTLTVNNLEDFFKGLNKLEKLPFIDNSHTDGNNLEDKEVINHVKLK